ATRDLNQVEKWMEEKKWVDATRRTKAVQDKKDKIDPKVQERAKEIEDKLKKTCAELIEQAKPLAEDPAKKAEAKKALDEIIAAFGKYEECKEAKELLKKVQ